MTLSIAISHWGWPQYVYLTLALLTLFGSMATHGKPRTPMDGYVALSTFCIASFLLIAGGFFA